MKRAEYATPTRALETLIELKAHVNIFLSNGIRLTGEVVSQDEHAILLKEGEGPTVIVYKAHIASIVNTSRT